MPKLDHSIGSSFSAVSREAQDRDCNLPVPSAPALPQGLNISFLNLDLNNLLEQLTEQK